MATRINTKFVITLAVVLVVLTAGVVYAVMRYNRGAEDYARMADQLMKQAQEAEAKGEIEEANSFFKRAAGRYGDARDKDAQSTAYIYSWIDAQNSIKVTDLSAAYNQLQEEVKGASTIQNTIDASNEDREFLYELLHKRVRMNLVANTQHPINMLHNFAQTRLSKHPDDAIALKYSSITESHFVGREPNPDARKRVLDQINAAIEADPDSAILHTAAARYHLNNRARLYSSAGDTITDQVKEATDRCYESAMRAVELAKEDNPSALIRAAGVLLSLRVSDQTKIAEYEAAKITTVKALSELLSDKAMRDRLFNEELSQAAVYIGFFQTGNEENPFDGKAEELKLAKAVVEDRSGDPGAYAILGRVYRKHRELAKTEETIEEGLAIDRVTNAQEFVLDQSARLNMLSTLAEVKIELAGEAGLDPDRRAELLDEAGDRIEQLADVPTAQGEIRDARIEFLKGQLEFTMGRANQAVVHFTNVLATDSTNMQALQLLARCYQRMNQDGKVNETYEQIVALQPNSRLRLELINSYLRNVNDKQQLAQAKMHLDFYQQLNPKDIFGTMLRAQLLVATNQVTQAIELLKAQDPKAHPDLTAKIAEYQVRIGKTDDAAKMLRDRIADRPEGQPMDIRQVRTLIQVLPSDEAKIAELNRLEQNGFEPKVAKVLRNYIVTGRRTLEGELVLLEYLELEPANLAIEKFQLYQQWNEPELANEQLDEAIRLDPGLPVVIEWRYRTALVNKDWDAAKDAIADMRKVDDKKLPDLAVADGVFMKARLQALQAAEMESSEDRTRSFLEARGAYENALKEYKDYVDGWVELGQIQLIQQDFYTAELSLQQALNRQSTHRQALDLMSRVEAQNGKLASAMQRLELLLRLQPSHPNALDRYTTLATQAGVPERAIRLREVVRDLSKNNTANRRTLAALYTRQGEYEKAKAEVNAAIEIEGRTRANVGSLSQILIAGDQKQEGIDEVNRYIADIGDKLQWQDLILLAGAYNAAEQYIRADIEFAKAVKMEGDESLNTAAIWGQTLLQRGEAAKAAELYEGLIKKQPENEQLKEQTARIYLQVGNIAKAESIAEQMDKTPNRYLLLIQAALANENNVSLAIERARAGVDSFPDSTALGIRLSRLLLGVQATRDQDKRVYDEPLKIAKRLTDQEPGSVEAKLLLADVLLSMGQIDDAEEVLIETVKLAPNNLTANERRFSILLARARAAAASEPDKSKDFANQALRIINSLIEIQPNAASLYRSAGDAATLAGFNERASERYGEAFERSNDARDLSSYATSLLNLDQGRAALSLLRDPDNATLVSSNLYLRALIGRAMSASGNGAGAANLFQNILKSTDDLSAQLLLVQQIALSFPGEAPRILEIAKAGLGNNRPYQVDMLLASAHLSQQLYPAAVDLLARFEKQPVAAVGDQFRIMLQLALARQESGQLEPAKLTYEKTLELAQKHPEQVSKRDQMHMLNNLAYLLSDKMQGYEKQAVSYAKQAYEVLPKNADGRTIALIEDTYGWALYRASKVDESSELLDEALRMLVDSVDNAELAANQYHLGRVYLAKGDNNNAQKYLKRAYDQAVLDNDSDLIKETDNWYRKVK